MDDIIAKAAATVDPAQRAALYRDFQKLAGAEQPIVHVAEFTFITVARTSVRNVANNPRWATSHWADTWLQA
jgi:peptide/nickel transport system substrate-binding protein